jgi:hypothetical protein
VVHIVVEKAHIIGRVNILDLPLDVVFEVEGTMIEVVPVVPVIMVMISTMPV